MKVGSKMEGKFEKEIQGLSKHDKAKEEKKEKLEEDFTREKEKYSEGDIKKMSEIAKKKLAEALNKKAESTISISKEGNEWLANVEVLEEEYIPGMNLRSMNDIIGIYEVKLNNKCELLNWSKKSSRKRGEFSR